MTGGGGGHPSVDSLQACIHDSLIKDAKLDEARAAKIAADYGSRALPDAGPPPPTLGVDATNHTISNETLQAMTENNVGQVIDVCAAKFGAVPPDIFVTVNVLAARKPRAGAYVWNMADDSESCTTKPGSGTCPLLLHHVKRGATFRFGLKLPGYLPVSAAAPNVVDGGDGGEQASPSRTSEFPFDALPKGIELDVAPSGNVLHVFVKEQGDVPVTGAFVTAISDAAFTNDPCFDTGAVTRQCNTAVTDPPTGEAVFHYDNPVAMLSLVVAYRGKTKTLYQKRSEQPLDAQPLELHWSDDAQGLAVGAGSSAPPAQPFCLAGGKNAVLAALRQRTKSMPLPANGSIGLEVQIDPVGRVLSVGGDHTNALYRYATSALTAAPVDVKNCDAHVTWTL
jgi:hypothetical protein